MTPVMQPPQHSVAAQMPSLEPCSPSLMDGEPQGELPEPLEALCSCLPWAHQGELHVPVALKLPPARRCPE